jgi:hypothetical protein
MTPRQQPREQPSKAEPDKTDGPVSRKKIHETNGRNTDWPRRRSDIRSQGPAMRRKAKAEHNGAGGVRKGIAMESRRLHQNSMAISAGKPVRDH